MKKTKKLVLSAETIRQMSAADLAIVVGGAENTVGCEKNTVAQRTKYRCPGGDPASDNSCNNCW